MRLQASGDIDRPVAEVFRFYADGHVDNHPRWDPDVKLTTTDDGPLGVGSVIKRHITRLGQDVHGEMTVTEFERDHAFAVEIRDGPVPMTGRTTFAPQGDGTRLVVSVDAPMIEDPKMGEAIAGLMQRSVDNIKRLLEASGTRS